ncbi:MAG: hypothetical protein WC531_01725 [Candidatus Paceibacterota bacterium]
MIDKTIILDVIYNIRPYLFQNRLNSSHAGGDGFFFGDVKKVAEVSVLTLQLVLVVPH